MNLLGKVTVVVTQHNVVNRKGWCEYWKTVSDKNSAIDVTFPTASRVTTCID